MATIKWISNDQYIEIYKTEQGFYDYNVFSFLAVEGDEPIYEWQGMSYRDDLESESEAEKHAYENYSDELD